MVRSSTILIRLSVAAAAGGAALLWSGDLSPNSQTSFVSSAEARVGRPLTPVSYAGVARRTTRRAVAVPTAGAVYAAPVVVVTPSCGQAVDAYGRIVTVCR
jgi:hypothetical protein